jgi:hypothetical protein
MLATPETEAHSSESGEGTATSTHEAVELEILQGAHKLKFRNNRRLEGKRRTRLLKSRRSEPHEHFINDAKFAVRLGNTHIRTQTAADHIF